MGALPGLTTGIIRMLILIWLNINIETGSSSSAGPSCDQRISEGCPDEAKGDLDSLYSPDMEEILQLYPEDVTEEYTSLCTKPSPTDAGQWIKPHMKCRLYRHVNRYESWKIELMSQDPELILVHDFIDVDEISYLMETAQLNLEESDTVGSSSQDMSRTSQSSWIHVPTSTLNRIERRIADFTGLLTGVNFRQSDAEILQVHRYLQGGYYKPHFDFMQGLPDPQYLEGSGDRMATFMIYLQEAVEGGATLFLKENLLVQPEKGAGLFWYNLHKSGQPDIRTLHAGCTVLAGEKWIATKWIRERSQIWLRPCGLRPSD